MGLDLEPDALNDVNSFILYESHKVKKKYFLLAVFFYAKGSKEKLCKPKFILK